MTQIVSHEDQARTYPREVWFSGSTALVRGQGLCYDYDYYTSTTGEAVTDAWEKRSKTVQVPSTSNNLAFAGVASTNYKAQSGGQWITIYEPGSTCEIAIGKDTTINSTVLTCSVNAADAGRFTFDGFTGRGTAIALQTNTGGNVFESFDGTARGAYAGSVFTITKTGIGTACGYGDSTVDPTDFTVVILGGADNDTGGDATGIAAGTSDLISPASYTVATAPTADTITIGDNDLGTDLDLCLYVIEGNPRCLAYLFDGEPSGLQEVVTPQDAVAVASMVGGCTFVCGGYTMVADSTHTLADGTSEGQKKAFLGLGTLTTKSYVVTVTSGMQADGTTALASITINAANEVIVLQWHGNIGGGTAGVWTELMSAGATKG